jgi:hypothetical protein
VCGSPTNFTPQKDARFVFASEAEIGYYSPKYRVCIKSFRLQTFITRKISGTETYFLPLLKLVSKETS